MRKNLMSYIITSLFIIIFITGCSTSELKNITADALDKNDPNVQLVKNGSLNAYPNIKIVDAFTNFFGSPHWKYFKADSGEKIVEFNGDCTYVKVKVKANLQFIIKNDNSFEVGALSFNDVPQDLLTKNIMLSKIFDEYDEKTNTRKGNSNQTSTPPQTKSTPNPEEDFKDPRPEGDTKGEWAKTKNTTDGSVKIWNPSPKTGETVEWSGNKILHQDLMGKNQQTGFPIYYAHGFGKAIWYDANGTFEQSDEGTFSGGKRHGKITQKFADGRVTVTEWNYGIKVN